MRMMLSFILSTIACSIAMGQAPTVSISPGTNASSSVSLLGDGRYDVSLSTTYTGGTTTFTVSGGSGTAIRNVYVSNTAASQQTHIHIHGASSTNPIAEVEAIDQLSSTGFVALYTLRTTGDVGTIRLNRIGGQSTHVVNIGGSLTGGMEILSHANQHSVEYTTIQGDCQGNISLPSTGSILGLTIAGNLGYSAAPVTVTSGNIQRLEVGSAAYATITSGGSGLIQRFATGSSLVGSISAVSFAAVGGGATGVVIGNECRGNITLSGHVQVPLTITGALRGTVQATTSSSNTPIVIGSIPAASSPHAEGVLRLTRTAGGANGGTITVNGDVAGRMEIGGTGGNIVMNITINGELSGELVSSGSLTSGDTITITDGITATGLLSLGDSLIGSIALPASGLAGQIIINANDNGGDWDGNVVIGSGGGAITLGPGQSPPYQSPHYAALPSALGGGSVGLAPFGLHAEACTPPHNLMDPHTDLVYTDFDNDGMPVIIRSYGPITNANVDFDMQLNDECTWHEDVDAMFVPVLHPGGDPRSIGIKCDSASSMKRGIIRVESASVACAEVAGNPLVEWQTDDDCVSEPTASYVFLVAPDCDGDGLNDWFEIDRGEEHPNDEWPDIDSDDNDVIDSCEVDPCACDWDGNFFVEVPDIFAFLASWFANEPRADFDSSGTIAVPDIFAFLSCWFASSDSNRCDE